MLHRYLLLSAFVLLPAVATAQTRPAPDAFHEATTDQAPPRLTVHGSGTRLFDGAFRASLKTASVPLDVVVAGAGTTGTLFVECDGNVVYQGAAVDGPVTVDAPAGTCVVGLLNTAFDPYGVDADTLSYVIREVEAPTDAPVELDLGGDLRTAEVVLRDETGALVDLNAFGPASRTVLLSRAGASDDSFWSFALSRYDAGTGGSPPLPTLRYSIPDDLGYRIHWTYFSWPTAETVYRFKGALDAFGDDVTFENAADDLGRLTVDHRFPTDLGPLRGASTAELVMPRGANTSVPFWTFRLTSCIPDGPMLLPPYRQTIYAMAEPAPAPLGRPAVEVQLEPTSDLVLPNPETCGDLGAPDEFVAAPAPFRRGADGVFRAWSVRPEAGPGVPLTDELTGELAPLAFTPVIRDLNGSLFLDGAETQSFWPELWPLPLGGPGGFNWPLLYAQLGDARPVPMAYQIFDADGALLQEGPDLTTTMVFGLPPTVPATLQAAGVDAGVQVGGVSAGAEIELRYGHSPNDVSPPHLFALTVESDGGYTSGVPAGMGTVRFALSDIEGDAFATVEAAVRGFETDGLWTDLALIDEGDGWFRADLPELDSGLYDLRIETSDAANNGGRYVSTPAFEVTAPLATEAGAPAWRVGAPAPNPARTRAVLEAELSAAGPVHSVVYDLLGRRVLQTAAQCPAGSCPLTLDLTGLSPGTYIVRVRAGHHDATHRLTVMP